MKMPELKYILRKNNIKGWSHLNKTQMVELLKEKELFPVEPPKVTPKRDAIVNPKYPWLSEIRTKPKTVVLKDVATEEELTFPSLYKAARFIGKGTRTISFWDGRVWNSKYAVKIAQ